MTPEQISEYVEGRTQICIPFADLIKLLAIHPASNRLVGLMDYLNGYIIVEVVHPTNFNTPKS
jgi:hypothetical protein